MRVFFRLFIKRLTQDRLNNYSAQMAYTLLLAMFPILLFCGYLISIFHISADPLITFFQGNTSGQLFTKLNEFVNAQVHKANITFLSPIFIISLLSISFGLRPLIGALNHIYRIEETRTWIRNFFISLIGTIFLMCALIGAFILFLYNIAFQEIILSIFPVMNHFHSVLNIISCIVLLSSIFLFLIFAFTVMPAKRYRMRVNIRAAFYSSVLLFLFSIIFLYYVTYLNRTYNIFYGSLGSIIALITWFYFSSIAILLGLELEIIHEQIRHKREVPEIENHFLIWIDKGVRKLWQKK